MLHESLTPTGTLRASINVGNPILAKRSASGGVEGVSIDLTRELASRLGTKVEWVVFDTAAESVNAVRNGQADLGFFAIDPLRGEGIHFTPPYVMIEGSYLVKSDSAIHSNADVDHASNRIAVGQGSAYDLYLSRAIRAATLVRAPSSPKVVDTFLQQGLEVAAGVRQQLQADAQRISGLRLLPGRFMAIYQAMGLSKERGELPWKYLSGFIEEMKSSGFIAKALSEHGIQGVEIAPPGYPES